MEVVTFIDRENFKIGVECHDTDVTNSLTLAADNRPKNPKTKPGVFFSSRGLLKSNPWIIPLTKLKPDNRRFLLKEESKKWVAQLCPAFESSFSKDATSFPISSEEHGIYRYLDGNGAIVYIGRGNIIQRLKEEQRKDWNFVKVEYSLIASKEDQAKWESLWIEKFKNENSGALPAYNLISGKTLS